MCIFIMIIHFITASKVERFCMHDCVCSYMSRCTHSYINYIKSIYTVSLPTIWSVDFLGIAYSYILERKRQARSELIFPGA